MAAGNSKSVSRRTQLKLTSHGTAGSEETGDRLSDLPDNILHHILSFLTLKYIIQTSVLSRRWRYLWKDVPALNFTLEDFPLGGLRKFTEHIGKFLSHWGSETAAVSSVTFHNSPSTPQKLDRKLFDSILKYAAGSGSDTICQHGGLHQLIVHWYEQCGCTNFDRLAYPMTTHRHHESLVTFKLAECLFHMGDEFWLMKFSRLTTLELKFSEFSACSSVDEAMPYCDPFVDLPSLNHLKLLHCSSPTCCLRISGLQLLDLEIVNLGSPGIEVVAPKLKSIHLDYCEPTCLIELNVPSLDCANILVTWYFQVETDPHARERNEAYMNLLQGTTCALTRGGTMRIGENTNFLLTA